MPKLDCMVALFDHAGNFLYGHIGTNQKIYTHYTMKYHFHLYVNSRIYVVNKIHHNHISLVIGDGSDLQSALAQWTGLRTVPNVFIGGTHIGGCDSKCSKTLFQCLQNLTCAHVSNNTYIHTSIHVYICTSTQTCTHNIYICI